jgi:hypothetical protein
LGRRLNCYGHCRAQPIEPFLQHIKLWAGCDKLRLGWYNPLRYQRVGKSKCLLGYQDQVHIFQELKQRYFKDKSECDFIVKTGLEVTEAIQVSATLSDATTRQLELRGLTCCNKVGLRHGLIMLCVLQNVFLS